MMKSYLSLLALAIGASTVGASDESRFLQEDSNCTTIMEYICDEDGDFETDVLCTALQMADVGYEMESESAWTLFAPTNDAFDAIPAGIVNSLMGEDADDNTGLIDLLAFHSVGEVVESSDLFCDGRLIMANDEFSVTICEGERVYQVGLGNPIMDYPEIIMADIPTCNGVIHIVNKVML